MSITSGGISTPASAVRDWVLPAAPFGGLPRLGRRQIARRTTAQRNSNDARAGLTGSGGNRSLRYSEIAAAMLLHVHFDVTYKEAW
jgi:hypothetical protein